MGFPVLFFFPFLRCFPRHYHLTTLPGRIRHLDIYRPGSGSQFGWHSVRMVSRGSNSREIR